MKEKEVWGIVEDSENSTVDTCIESLLMDYSDTSDLEDGEHEVEIVKGTLVEIENYLPGLDYILEMVDDNIADNVYTDDSIIEQKKGAEDGFKKMFKAFAKKHLKVRPYWVLNGERKKIRFTLKDNEIVLKN